MLATLSYLDTSILASSSLFSSITNTKKVSSYSSCSLVIYLTVLTMAIVPMTLLTKALIQ